MLTRRQTMTSPNENYQAVLEDLERRRDELTAAIDAISSVMGLRAPQGQGLRAPQVHREQVVAALVHVPALDGRHVARPAADQQPPQGERIRLVLQQATEGLTVEDIASLSDVPPGNVRARLAEMDRRGQVTKILIQPAGWQRFVARYALRSHGEDDA